MSFVPVRQPLSLYLSPRLDNRQQPLCWLGLIMRSSETRVVTKLYFAWFNNQRSLLYGCCLFTIYSSAVGGACVPSYCNGVIISVYRKRRNCLRYKLPRVSRLAIGFIERWAVKQEPDRTPALALKLHGSINVRPPLTRAAGKIAAAECS